MILDGHIHIQQNSENKTLFVERLAEAGVSGGIVLSRHPACFEFGAIDSHEFETKTRLDGLFTRTSGNPNLYPFFWIDPMEPDAEAQVDIACQYGVLGFKVICDHYFPYDDRPMAIFRKIASVGKPILFHSGILWDGKFSSPYNKPVGFEALINIEGLRFSLAHASWPWCDECIALYGKFQNTQTDVGRPTAEMFIDITPGTPEIYRRELLTKLYTVGYDIENNIVFGMDCGFDDYSSAWAKRWVGIDSAIYQDLKLSNETIGKVFAGNLQRFVGITNEKIMKKALTQVG
jgi:predicted TIM-barrel fold metal-dependent hydrolase